MYVNVATRAGKMQLRSYQYKYITHNITKNCFVAIVVFAKTKPYAPPS